ncbi:MAG: hypothetical protein Q7N50_05055, partial [Armatimonadota bacterium]|nr:hypothetical protein [Armatimonadota bacterium]
MSNRLLTYAIVISIAIHVVILGVIGKTSAAKPIDLESLKLVKVDLVKTPDDIKLASAQQPKPEPQDSAEPAPYVPPIKQMKAAPPPSPKAVARVAKAMIKPGPLNPANRTVSHSPPGNPGGALNLGSTSSHGENLGSSSGTSEVGYVPNNSGGSGVGSGTGAGVGTPDPPKNADDGPGLTPAPAPPPPPRMVEMTVCAVSGLKPGKSCEKKTSKNFREDDTPSRICDVCKEPDFV